MMASSRLALGGIGDEESVCYLCLDGGADEPLRRDCACRGTDAGFVHLSCLTKYAANKSKGWDGQDINEFNKPWRVCSNCLQEYQNELAVVIASEFASFVRGQYPKDTQMQVESLHLKLCAFDSMLIRSTAEQKREVGVAANVLLSFIDRMREAAPLTRRYSQFESYAYYTHGRIGLIEGSDESARSAEVNFEKDLKVCEAIGDADGIAIAKRNIAIARSKYESGNSNEEVLKASQKLYELRVAKLGEEHKYTIIAGKDYAMKLRKANRGGEAGDLLTKLFITSKQVLGPHHNTTKEVTSMLKKVVKAANHD
jgi:hypothetical protein